MKTKLFFLFSLLALAGVAAEPSKPNVLLICVDDLKPVLGCYGDKTVKSPNIDRLASRSVQFDRAFCNQAVCAPSRNALMTGLRPTTLGIYDLGTNFRKSRPDAVTVAQHFMKNGWKTEAMGKIMHVGHGNDEDVASWSVAPWKPKSNAFGGYMLPENRPATLTREEAFFANKSPANLPRGAAVEAAEVSDNAYGDGMIADEAIVRLRAAAAKPEQPFFIAVGFFKPHLPFVAPKKYWDLYKCEQFELAKNQKPPEGAPDFAPTSWGELRQYSDIPNSGPLTADRQRELIHGYHAAISYMDAQLGRVMDEFSKLGLGKNTIVVLWGDHGWHLGDHGMWCKHTNYEQAGRIPFLVYTPELKAGSKCGSLVETVDLYPTLCELAGLPTPDGLDGKSFANALRDPSNARTKEAVFHCYPRSDKMGRAVRTERYRLVEWKKIGEPADTAILELYDYEADPDETKNLAASQPEVVAKLRAILAQLPEAVPQWKAKAAPQKTPDAKSDSKDRGAMFDDKDGNRDGKLTLEEFLKKQPDPQEAPKRFPKFDKNSDGFLTREEFINAGK